MPRRKRGNVYSTPTEAIDAVRSLARACTDDVIAGVLNRNGLPTGGGERWTRQRITRPRGRNAILSYNRQSCAEVGWLKLGETADIVGASKLSTPLAMRV